MSTASKPADEIIDEVNPTVPYTESPPEFTLVPIITGAALGIIFAASSLYLVLKIGMTVSASIPVSVVAITLSRALWKRKGQKSILQNNIVQTTGSAGESIAFGVGVTMPALMLLGFDMTLPRVMVVSLLGGCVGILAMIPLRRAMIVRMHRQLSYPEGRAAAMVLQAGESHDDAPELVGNGAATPEKQGTSSAAIFGGFALAFLHKFITEGMNILKDTVKLPLPMIGKAATFANAMASELLGVGYIIGLRTSAIMMAGAFLGYLVIIPLIAYVGANNEFPIPPGEKLISEMSTKELRDNYLLFIGAGTVATAGIISMVRTMPMIVKSVVGMTKSGISGGAATTRRTDRDMPMSVVLFGSAGLIIALALFLMTEVGPVAAIGGAALVVIFGFLFVTVSARLTGEIGSSSNPISGMTVATLTMTCLIFLALGWTSPIERVLALSVAAVVCVASSNGGTTAQSLKTGHLVGGTPIYNQYAILIGAITSALVIGGTLLLFNASGTIYSSKPDNLPSVVLTQPELSRLTRTETHEGVTYKVWDTRSGELTKSADFNPRDELSTVKTGRYLVDPATGQVKFLKDFTIMGKLTETDDGKPIKREFDAPKTQVMGIIINGVLSGKLSWSLILMGALIAVVLELCGVSALAFAVGLYVPIQFSAPIFIGGCVRFVVDRFLARQSGAHAAAQNLSPAEAEAEAIRRSETSPGTLLAAGYIAGGSLAGMLIAFTNFSDTIPDMLNSWQYQSVKLTQTTPVDKISEDVLDMAENKDELAKYVPVKKGTKILLPKKDVYVTDKDTTLGDIAKPKSDGGATEKGMKPSKLVELNHQELTPFVVVPANTTIRLADYTFYHVKDKTTLGDLAAKELKGKGDPSVLLERNAKLPDRLENEGKKGLTLPDSANGFDKLDSKPKELPAGAELKQPQHDWPAIVAFAALVLILGVIGVGLLRRQT
jgi:putative OPT family oligopeptide transporter